MGIRSSAGGSTDHWEPELRPGKNGCLISMRRSGVRRAELSGLRNPLVVVLLVEDNDDDDNDDNDDDIIPPFPSPLPLLVWWWLLL